MAHRAFLFEKIPAGVGRRTSLERKAEDRHESSHTQNLEKR
jgi:hypothetical protein